MSRIPTRPKPLGGECENCGRPNQAPWCPDCYHAMPECVTCRHRVPGVDDAQQCPQCAIPDDAFWTPERIAWHAKHPQVS